MEVEEGVTKSASERVSATTIAACFSGGREFQGFRLSGCTRDVVFWHTDGHRSTLGVGSVSAKQTKRCKY